MLFWKTSKTLQDLLCELCQGNARSFVIDSIEKQGFLSIVTLQFSSKVFCTQELSLGRMLLNFVRPCCSHCYEQVTAFGINIINAVSKAFDLCVFVPVTILCSTALFATVLPIGGICFNTLSSQDGHLRHPEYDA